MISADVLAPLVFIAAGLLAWGGAGKVLRPGQTSRALREAGLPHAVWLVRAFGAAELTVGVAAVVAPDALILAALAALYMAFAAFLVTLIARRVPLTSCGCLGGIDSPPNLLHVAVNLAFATSGTLAATGGVPNLLTFLRAQPLEGIPVLVGVVSSMYLVSMAIALVPKLFFAYRRSGRTP